MKIKTFKTVTEEVEIDLPEFFEHDGYFYMTKGDTFTRVFTSTVTKYLSICIVESLTLNSDPKPITREQFYNKFCEAIELSTGFKFNPESDGELNNFAQSEDLESDVDQFMVQQYAHEREQFSC